MSRFILHGPDIPVVSPLLLSMCGGRFGLLFEDQCSHQLLSEVEVKDDFGNIGINKCARESGFDRKNFVRDIPVKRNSYNEFLRWLNGYKSAVVKR